MSVKRSSNKDGDEGFGEGQGGEAFGPSLFGWLDRRAGQTDTPPLPPPTPKRDKLTMLALLALSASIFRFLYALWSGNIWLIKSGSCGCPFESMNTLLVFGLCCVYW